MPYGFNKISVMLSALFFLACAVFAGTPGKQPVFIFCGMGDNLSVPTAFPVDSPANVKAMMEWMTRTYGVKRLYWRTEEQYADDHKCSDYFVDAYDLVHNWIHYAVKKSNLDKVAVDSAHAEGMEVFYYTGLFEYGVQPDVGVICPYIFEDRLRRENPEWCELDRWGQRRSPGPVAYCYPQVRKAVIDRLLYYVDKDGYDGINFYTYVENLGLLYPDEFGFEKPVVEKFNQKYPNVDIKSGNLTPQQKEYWYKCRGEFITQFLGELHAELAKRGKKLSMILDSKNPEYPQPWWGHEIPGTGYMYFDWGKWIDDGIVDEIWVQLGDMANQKKTLDKVLAKLKSSKKKIGVTVRTPKPFDAFWEPYVQQGVTPLACITLPVNGVEKFSLEPMDVGQMKSKDWRNRVQVLKEIGDGKIFMPSKKVAEMANDEHVLVRREAMITLGKMKATAQVPVLEKGLFDTESSVRVGAALGLSKIKASSATPILKAIEKDGSYLFKSPATVAICNCGPGVIPVLEANLKNPNIAVREVCIRALGKFGCTQDGCADKIYGPLLEVMMDDNQPDVLRYWAITRIVNMCNKMSKEHQKKFIDDLIALLQGKSDYVQLWSANSLRSMVTLMDQAQKKKAIASLAELFKKFGDGCKRKDASFGWRVVGNTMLAFGPDGKSELENMRCQKSDKWLAWAAYEVVYLRQTPNTNDFTLINEKQAIEDHKLAPEFPGWRKW